MTGESVQITLPFSCLASGTREVTSLYRELREPLLRYLVCLGLSKDEAQDVVQDAFLSLHRHLTAGGAQTNIRGWLFRVAHNQARNRQGSYHRRFAEPLDPHFAPMVDESPREPMVLEKEKLNGFEKALAALTVAEGEGFLFRAPGYAT